MYLNLNPSATKTLRSLRLGRRKLSLVRNKANPQIISHGLIAEWHHSFLLADS